MNPEATTRTMQPWLNLQPEELHKEFTLVTKETLGRNVLYHMSTDNNIPFFQPNVTNRTATKENRSIPRICTADTIVGCILGYSKTTSDFFNREDGQKVVSKKGYKFRGGWVIYGIPFDVAILPSKKLLPDVDRTNEHWLVGYDKDTLKYPCNQIAKMFFTGITYRATNAFPKSTIEMMVHVLTDEPLYLTSKQTLEKGYYLVELDGLFDARNIDQGYGVVIKEIDQDLFEQQKTLVASTLSFETLPPSAKW